jgi:hypothetical protein
MVPYAIVDFIPQSWTKNLASGHFQTRAVDPCCTVPYSSIILAEWRKVLPSPAHQHTNICFSFSQYETLNLGNGIKN